MVLAISKHIFFVIGGGQLYEIMKENNKFKKHIFENYSLLPSPSFPSLTILHPPYVPLQNVYVS